MWLFFLLPFLIFYVDCRLNLVSYSWFNFQARFLFDISHCLSLLQNMFLGIETEKYKKCTIISKWRFIDFCGLWLWFFFFFPYLCFFFNSYGYLFLWKLLSSVEFWVWIFDAMDINSFWLSCLENFFLFFFRHWNELTVSRNCTWNYWLSEICKLFRFSLIFHLLILLAEDLDLNLCWANSS